MSASRLWSLSMVMLPLALAAGLTACAAPAPPSYAVLAASSANVASPVAPAPWQEEEAAAAEEGGGFLHGLVLYLPNRIFDVFDIVRARVRLGPGIAVGVRATQIADAYVGTYATIFAGLPGPRGEPAIPWPVGFESKSGVEVSLADATLEGPIGPGYGMAEIGVDFQLAIIGVAVGVEPFEVLDFVLGLVTIDFAEDDY